MTSNEKFNCEHAHSPHTCIAHCSSLLSYKQSLWAANEARRLFTAADKPFGRPSDFFAEMVKTDDHMERVRQRLVDEASGIKASEEAKKQRHLKKFGKQVQVAKLQERQREKKGLAEKVKEFKKSQLCSCCALDCTI